MRRAVVDCLWLLPMRLTTLTMVLTIAAIAAIGMLLLQLPLGASILLGAVLGPTDPVLTSDVQVQNATDQDELRYSISGEAGPNDGSTFPFVMLGLGLLHMHQFHHESLAQMGQRWCPTGRRGWSPIVRRRDPFAGDPPVLVGCRL